VDMVQIEEIPSNAFHNVALTRVLQGFKSHPLVAERARRGRIPRAK